MRYIVGPSAEVGICLLLVTEDKDEKFVDGRDLREAEIDALELRELRPRNYKLFHETMRMRGVEPPVFKGVEVAKED